MKPKQFEDYTFEELVDRNAQKLLQDILAGTKFRTAAWRLTELSVLWRAAQEDKRKKKKK